MSKLKKPWWSKKWGKDKICPITQTRLRPGKSKKGVPYTITLKCNHSFNAKAIAIWFINNDTCPICRKTLS